MDNKPLTRTQINNIKKYYARNKSIEEIAEKLKLPTAIVRIYLKIELKKDADVLLKKDPQEVLLKEVWALNYLEEEILDRYEEEKSSWSPPTDLEEDAFAVNDQKYNWVKPLALALNVMSSRQKLLQLDSRYANEVQQQNDNITPSDIFEDIASAQSSSILDSTKASSNKTVEEEITNENEGNNGK